VVPIEQFDASTKVVAYSFDKPPGIEDVDLPVRRPWPSGRLTRDSTQVG
jgi:hypothetical protein